jgi:hypothetical protein
MKNAKARHLARGGLTLKNNSMKKQKVIVYVDGFNFYYGLKAAAEATEPELSFYTNSKFLFKILFAE